MRIEVTNYDNGDRVASVYPVDTGQLSITCAIDAPRPWRPTARYTVDWPVIGYLSIAEARQFAAAIIAGCDWLEKEASCETS